MNTGFTQDAKRTALGVFLDQSENRSLAQATGYGNAGNLQIGVGRADVRIQSTG